jgi:RNA polymerase sigma factor (sigma-70 family)
MAISHHYLLNLALEQDRAEWTDGQLLEGYVCRKDTAALEALVLRHGPMVWGVCCRLLKRHDAEDAFQATFLILIRKAASIVPRGMVGNWLYGVAHQTALNLRTQILRRGAREVQVTELPHSPTNEGRLWEELKPLLDQELSRLPSKYRSAVLLCDLEGKTRKEAARQLGVAEGTVASRLARGRSMLANRLARHGLVVSVGTLEAVLGQKASGAVPNTVMASAIETFSLVISGNAATMGLIQPKVASLTEGVLRAMFATKLKVGLAALVMLGMGAFTYGMLGTGKMDAKTDEPAAKTDDKSKEPEGDAAQALKVTIKLGTAHIQFRDKFNLDLRVENVSKEIVSFESATCSWIADWTPSTKRVSWETWECFSNRLVTVKLKPGETYEKSLAMFLVPGDQVSFKMGFTPRNLTPKNSKQTYWSNELTLQIDKAKQDPGKTDPPALKVDVPSPMPEKANSSVPANLLKARLDAAKEAYRVALEYFRAGNGNTPEDIYTWSVRWLHAQLDLSDKRDERIAALEEHTKRMKDLQKLVESIAPARLTQKEIVAARWYLAEAEIGLAKEK